MPRPNVITRARYGLLRDETGEWLSKPELIPTVGVFTRDPAQRRGWAGDSTARQFLRRHPEYKRVGFKVRPIDD